MIKNLKLNDSIMSSLNDECLEVDSIVSKNEERDEGIMAAEVPLNMNPNKMIRHGFKV